MATDTTAGAALGAENRSVEIDGATLVHRRFGGRESDAPRRSEDSRASGMEYFGRPGGHGGQYQ